MTGWVPKSEKPSATTMLLSRGTRVNRTYLWYTQKPTYYRLFTNNIWSCFLLWSPAMVHTVVVVFVLGLLYDSAHSSVGRGSRGRTSSKTVFRPSDWIPYFMRGAQKTPIHHARTAGLLTSYKQPVIPGPPRLKSSIPRANRTKKGSEEI